MTKQSTLAAMMLLLLTTLLPSGVYAEILQVKSGDTLEHLTERIYGHRYTISLLKQFNHLKSDRLKIDQKIEAPPLDKLVVTMIAKPGYTPYVKPIVDAFDRFNEFYRHRKGDINSMLTDLRALQERAKKDKVFEGNISFFNQLKNATRGLETIATKPDYRTYDYWMEDVYQPLVLALESLVK